MIYARKNFFLLDDINRLIEIFKSAGLVDFWYSKFIKTDIFVDEDKQPKVINLNKFKGCFDVFLFGCVVSLTAFLIELVVGKLSRCHRK